jgi:hypothetical protein
VLEALDLALGAERSGRPGAIDEHDFHRGRYVGDPSTEPPTITITVDYEAAQTSTFFVLFSWALRLASPC